ncbi:MAG: IS1634 family transposase, partial [Alphaproteobacteria bacterium]
CVILDSMKTTIGASINVLQPGAAPVALALARMAGIRQIVERFLGINPDDRGISPGILAETLVAAILCGCRPLYRVEKFWENKPLGIFYAENITADQLNDDAYARLLDKLSEIDGSKLFEAVCLEMLQYHSLDIVLAHSDTTSISVEGIYDRQNPEEPLITFGHSKDKRPDLKQIKMGLSVQQQGLPLSGEIIVGNTSDQVWNPEAVQALSKLLSEGGYQNTIFLADCALISTSSLEKLSREGVSFISRLPETFGIAGDLKEAAWAENRWDPLGTLAGVSTKNAAQYKVWSTTRKLGERNFGFLVCAFNQP